MRIIESANSAASSMKRRCENSVRSMIIRLKNKLYFRDGFARMVLAASIVTIGICAEKPASAIESSQFSIAAGRVGPVRKGMSLNDVEQVVPSERMKSRDYIWMGDPQRDLQVYASADKTGNPRLTITLSGKPNWKVGTIEVFDPRYFTDKGITPGSTLGMLKSAYARMPVVWGDEGKYGISLMDANVAIFLDVGASPPNLNLKTFKGELIDGWPAAKDFDLVPDSTTVKSILVY